MVFDGVLSAPGIARRVAVPDFDQGQDALKRAINERAREFAAGDRAARPRRYGQHAIALAGALLVVALVFFGFDSFLTGMQKVVGILAADPAPPEAMPVFMVPGAPDQP